MNGLVQFNLCTLTDAELAKRVDGMTDEMYRTGVIPPRHIPARPDKDYDLAPAQAGKEGEG